jgi:hypothetical protein
MIGGVLEISELHVMISMLDLGYCLYVPDRECSLFGAAG